MVFKLRAEGEQDSPGWECRQQSLWQEECMEVLRGAEKGPQRRSEKMWWKERGAGKRGEGRQDRRGREGKLEHLIKKEPLRFPWWSSVKNPPANAGDVGWIPGPGRPHLLRGNSVHVPQLLMPSSLEPTPCSGKPKQWEAHARQLENSPCSPQLEKACAQQWRPRATKNK